MKLFKPFIVTIYQPEMTVLLSHFKSSNHDFARWVMMSSVHKRKNRMTIFATPQKTIHFIKMNNYYIHLCVIKWLK